MGIIDRIRHMAASAAYRAARARKGGGGMGTGKTAEPGKIYSIEARGIDGKPKAMSAYKNQPLLIVNVASKCGFTPQYEGLEALHKRYGPRGLRVLGFPCNQFGGQEPDGEAKIEAFCRRDKGVTFELFAKVEVNGPGAHPLYKLLTGESGFDGEIGWNFAKFLVARDGRVAARFEPDDEPMSPKVIAAIERALG